MERTRNDLGSPLGKFCLAVEEHRRTPEGRVRTAEHFLAFFFPPDGKAPQDRIFLHIPQAVRGPIISGWGIRGAKAALRDDDEKVSSVVFDSLVAGDLVANAFEDGLPPAVVIGWAPLADWWTFWRQSALTKPTLLKALVTAYDLGLFDARWLLSTLESRGGELKGTDVLSTGLTKDELAEWIRKVHESGNGSPKGLLEALGWDKLVHKAPNEALLGVLDAFARKVALVTEPEPSKEEPATAAGEGPAASSIANALTQAADGNTKDVEEAVTSHGAEEDADAAFKTDPPPAEEGTPEPTTAEARAAAEIPVETDSGADRPLPRRLVGPRGDGAQERRRGHAAGQGVRPQGRQGEGPGRRRRRGWRHHPLPPRKAGRATLTSRRAGRKARWARTRRLSYPPGPCVRSGSPRQALPKCFRSARPPTRRRARARCACASRRAASTSPT